jgi:hypothetical protein
MFAPARHSGVLRQARCMPCQLEGDPGLQSTINRPGPDSDACRVCRKPFCIPRNALSHAVLSPFIKLLLADHLPKKWYM